MHVRLPLTLVLISCLLISGCGSLPDPHVIVSWPHNGTIITLSETLNAHDDIVEPYYYSSAYVQFEMDVIPPTHDPSCPYPAVLIEPRDNGGSFIGIPADTYVTGICSGVPPIQQQSFRWQTQSLGLHTLSAHIIVMNDTGASREFDSDSITVCVVGDPLHPPQNIPMGLTTTDCNPPIPLMFTATPVTPIPMPNLDAAVQAYPDPIYYGDTCPSLSTVTFRAALPIPSGATPDQFTLQAYVRVIIGLASTDSGSFLVNLHPTGTWDAATGGQVFLGTLDLSHRYNDTNNHFDPGSLSGTSGALLWYVDASRLDPSSYLGRSANQVLNLAQCPASVGNPPSHHGSGTQSGCGQYTNQTSCNLAGCSWNPQNSTCSVNP